MFAWLGRRWLAIGAVVTLVGALTLAINAVVGHYQRVETAVHRALRPAADCVALTSPRLAPHPVSVAAWEGDRYLICNYEQIQEVDLRTGAVTTLDPEPRPHVWMPTGLHVRPDLGLVFVANYLGGDVLVLRREGNRLHIVQRITHPEMRSPENIATDATGNRLGVADYDGHRLWLFRRDGTLAWSRPLGMAHGVDFGPDFVVATSLEERCLVLYDLDGNERQRTGDLGIREGRFLWPTCVVVHGDRVLVSDAHTGRVTSFDHHLRVQDWFGGNGPGAGLFNMPYSIDRRRDFVICDTFKDRLLVLDDAGECRRILAREPAPLRWDAALPPERFRRGYTNLAEFMPPSIPGLPSVGWSAGYGLYRLARRVAPVAVTFPQSGTLFNHAQPYVCWGTTAVHRGQSYLLLGHSQGKDLLAVDARGRCFTQDVGETLWLVSGVLQTNAGEVFDVEPALERAAATFALHDRLRREGVDPTEAVRRAYRPQQSPKAFSAEMTATLHSPSAQAFLQAWRSAGTDADRQAAAAEFDAALARDKGGVPLECLFLRNMLWPR